MKAQALVEGSERLVEAMGRWPSFHDANVLSLSRSEGSCTVVIHVFEMTNEIDKNRFFVLKKHHLVSIEMQGISSNSLAEPYKGDVLSDLFIGPSGDLVEVRFESHMDQDGEVLCRGVRITNVVPCDADGSVRI